MLASQGSLRLEALVTIASRWHQKYISESRRLLAGVTVESWEKKFPDTVAVYRRLNPDPDLEALVPRVVDMWLDATEAGYANEALERIDCPTLIVRGDDDHLLSVRAAVEAAEMVPNGHFLNIPFEGHGLFPEQKEILMLAVNRFLEASNT